MVRVRGWLSVLFLACAPLGAASPDPATLVVSAEDLASARGWITELNAEQYRDREAATARLAAFGRKALIPLADAKSDPRPEIAERVRLLYPRAAAADLDARIETFLADTDERFSHDLPGWSRYVTTVGAGPAARDLFIEILRDRNHLELLASLAAVPADRRLPVAAAIGGTAFADADKPPPDRIRQALANRRLAMQSRANAFTRPSGSVVRQPTLPEIAMILFAESMVPEETLLFNANQFSASTYFYQPICREALLGNGKHAAAFRTLAHNWLDTRLGPVALTNAMNTSIAYKFEQELTLRIAGRMLATPNAMPHTRSSALCMIARLNGRAYLPAVLLLLNDESALMTLGVAPNATNIEVRDLALLTAVHLTGQTSAAYGFLTTPGLNDDIRFSVPAARYAATPSAPKQDELRKIAFNKWTTWELGLGGAVAGPLGPLGLLHGPKGRLAPKPNNALPVPNLVVPVK